MRIQVSEIVPDSNSLLVNKHVCLSHSGSRIEKIVCYLVMTKVKFHSSAFIAGKLFYHPCVEVPRVCDQSFFD
jgi:hypothetical protein